MAEAEGFFSRNGLEVSSKQYEMGSPGLLAIGAGEGDVSIQTENATVTNIAKGIDAIVVATVATAPRSLKGVARMDVKTPRDLIGKKVGVPQGSSAEFHLATYLKTYHLDVSQLKLVNAPPPELSVMVYKGDIDAAFFWEPWSRKTLLLDKTGTTVQNGFFRDYNQEFLGLGYLTVRRKFAEEKPEAVRRLLKSLIEANAFADANKERAIQVARKVLRTSHAEAQDAIDDYPNRVALDRKHVVGNLSAVANWLKGIGKLKESVDWEKVVQPQYLLAVDPARVK